VSYGQDIWCAGHLVTGRLDRGPGLVARAIYRRLITARGTLRGGDEEAAYGLDLAEYVGAVGYETALAALPGLVRAECLKDDRISDVAVSVTQSQDSAGLISLTVQVNAVLVDESETFALTLSVNEVSVQILNLTLSESA
jgi:hypothetical protein